MHIFDKNEGFDVLLRVPCNKLIFEYVRSFVVTIFAIPFVISKAVRIVFNITECPSYKIFTGFNALENEIIIKTLFQQVPTLSTYINKYPPMALSIHLLVSVKTQSVTLNKILMIGPTIQK